MIEPLLEAPLTPSTALGPYRAADYQALTLDLEALWVAVDAELAS